MTFWGVVGRAGTGQDHTRCCLCGGDEDRKLPVHLVAAVVVVVVVVM